MTVRRAEPDDAAALQEMAAALSGSAETYDFADEEVFVWEIGPGEIGGFLSLSIRPWSEGALGAPVPHIEGWYVEPSLRRQGIGGALMDAAETWCRLAGFVELCSDAETANKLSLAAHRRLGFAPTLRLQYFRKHLIEGLYP